MEFVCNSREDKGIGTAKISLLLYPVTDTKIRSPSQSALHISKMAVSNPEPELSPHLGGIVLV